MAPEIINKNTYSTKVRVTIKSCWFQGCHLTPSGRHLVDGDHGGGDAGRAAALHERDADEGHVHHLQEGEAEAKGEFPSKTHFAQTNFKYINHRGLYVSMTFC